MYFTPAYQLYWLTIPLLYHKIYLVDSEEKRQATKKSKKESEYCKTQIQPGEGAC